MQFWHDSFPSWQQRVWLVFIQNLNAVTCILVCISTIKPPTQRRLRK